ncbi:MAG: serine/threonine protein kinase [Clostridia bacterium]|nr:serine/threonine protein kinase [Clostridia bacterium]
MLKKNDILNTSFDTYKVLDSSIGNGGNGTVYKVQNTDGGIFAAKVVCKTNLSQEKIKRFRNEINFCQKYTHPNVISIIDRGYLSKGTEEYLFYIMPFYQHNLKKKIENKIQEEVALKYFLQICEGLKFAHSHGSIHRDIKPDNILIDNADNCVVADFGIAHFEVFDKITAVSTKESSRLANFTYHAPEQGLKGCDYTKATDIFALGLILNEMFTGQVPAGDMYKKISEVNPSYKFLDAIVSKMIAQSASQRYQSIEELYIDFEARKAEQETNEKIAQLKTPLLDGEVRDSITDNPIKIVNIEVKGAELVITLNNNTNQDWVSIYYNSLSSYSSIGFSGPTYQDFKFNRNIATCNIGRAMQYSSINDSLRTLIADFKRAVEATNPRYAQHLVTAEERRKQTEIQRRREEIEKLEKENGLNQMLKGLL